MYHDVLPACPCVLQETGSLLVASSPEEVPLLEARAQALQAQGLAARLLDAGQLRAAEPALAVPAWGAALQLDTDAQIVGGGWLHAWLHGWMHGWYSSRAA